MYIFKNIFFPFDQSECSFSPRKWHKKPKEMRKIQVSYCLKTELNLTEMEYIWLEDNAKAQLIV